MQKALNCTEQSEQDAFRLCVSASSCRLTHVAADCQEAGDAGDFRLRRLRVCDNKLQATASQFQTLPGSCRDSAETQKLQPAEFTFRQTEK